MTTDQSSRPMQRCRGDTVAQHRRHYAKHRLVEQAKAAARMRALRRRRAIQRTFAPSLA